MALLLLKAVDFAAEKHKKQRRKNKDKTPYINHPIRVAQFLSDCGVDDVNVLVGAVLHDTVEDTNTTLKDIEEIFGKEISDLVSEVTDDKSLPKAERKILQIEHAKTASKGAQLIKLGDKLHNLSSLLETSPEGWDIKRIQGYFVWSMQVVEGCRGSNEMLEERLDDLFNKGKFPFKGDLIDCVPKDTNLDTFLKEYLENMSKVEN